MEIDSILWILFVEMLLGMPIKSFTIADSTEYFETSQGCILVVCSPRVNGLLQLNMLSKYVFRQSPHEGNQALSDIFYYYHITLHDAVLMYFQF